MYFSTSDTKIDTKILSSYKSTPTHVLKYFYKNWDPPTVLKWAAFQRTYFEHSPRCSVRQAARELQMSKSTIQRY